LNLDPSKGSARLLFLDKDHVRIFKGESGPKASSEGTSMLEFDVAQKTLRETGQVSAQPYLLRVDSTCGRMLAVFQQQGGNYQLALCDARTGAVLKTLTEWQPHYPSASFMNDGRILAAERGSTQSTLRLYSSEGELQRTCPLGASRVSVAGPDVRGGKVVLETWESNDRHIDTGDVRLFDPATGDLQILPGLLPTHWNWWWSGGAPAGPAGAVTSRIFPNDKGQLVRYDFGTGTATPVKF